MSGWLEKGLITRTSGAPRRRNPIGELLDSRGKSCEIGNKQGRLFKDSGFTGAENKFWMGSGG